MPIHQLPNERNIDPKAVFVAAGATIRPVDNFVVVRRESLSAQSAGGIALADTSRTRYEGVVVEVGPNVPSKFQSDTPSEGSALVAIGSNVTVDVGDRVIFLPHAGIPVRRGDEDLIVFRSDAIFALIELPSAESPRKTARRRS